jgi:hypothetical protein
VQTPALAIKHQSDTQVYATWGPVLIRIVDGAATEPADMDRLHALFLELLDVWPTIGMLLIAHHGNPIPSMATLRYGNQLMGQLDDRLVVGIALLGLGYWAEASRTTINILARLVRGNTFILANSVESAVDKMAFELVGLDREQLCLAATKLERQFRNKP